MTVTKWVLADPTDSTSHTFELNPDPTKGSMGEVTFEAAVGDNAITDLGPVLVLTADKELTAEFQLSVYDQAEYQTLEAWYEKGDILTLTDDLGRVSTIYLTTFSAKRERVASRPWKHTITCSYLILSLVDI
jgi:hypothetical protein